MTRRHNVTRGRIAGLLLAAAVAITALGVATPAAARTDGGFVSAKAGKLWLDGKPFEFAGANNYYLGYKSSGMVDAVLDDAAEAGLDVVRTWGFQDYQNPDGSGSVHQNFEGVWYQAWDAAAGRPVVNTGDDGLERLDYVVAAAGQRGLRLVIPFVNNWNAFGGMDQYVRWAGLDEHADFYTDPTVRGWFRDWISTLLNRTNTYTGVKYKDDPTILAWELANEPRCTGAGVYPDGDCDADTITTWAAEMSAHVKSIDSSHLLSAGDEGFFCRSEDEWTLAARYGASGYGEGFGEDCADGVDTVALASLPDIDLMSMHLYPDHWQTSTAWGTGWIEEHAAAAAAVGKPVYLGEFGLTDKATRMPVYHEWLQAIRQNGVDGALYWILSAEQDDGTLYADYDGFTVYCPSPVCELMSAHAALAPRAGGGALQRTIADDDVVTTVRDTGVTIEVLANDVSFGAPVKASTLDLDASAPGRQATTESASGSFEIVSDGRVAFTPAEGFLGTAALTYSVSNGRARSTATVSVTVRPAAPGDPEVLASWEDGLSGWTPANWQSDPGVLAIGPEGATDGDAALQVTSKGAWFGSASDSPSRDLSSRTAVEFDVTTYAAGTSVAVAVRHGDAWSWCQSPWQWVPEHTSSTVAFALDGFGCAPRDLVSVHDVIIYFNQGEFSVDRLTIR